MKQKNKKGFTLIELLVVLAILGIIFAIIYDYNLDTRNLSREREHKLQAARAMGPQYKVTDKFLKNEEFHIYLKAVFPVLNGSEIEYEVMDERLFLVKTPDPNEYARLEKGRIYSKKDLPLAAVINRLKTVKTPAEMPDAEE